MLLVRDDESGSLFEESLNRFGNEELKRKVLVLAVVDSQHVLAAFAEVHLVDVDVLATFSKGGDQSLLRVLRLDLQLGVAGVERELRIKIGRNGHPRNDRNIKERLLIEDLPDAVVIWCPVKPEVVSLAASGLPFWCKHEVRGGQPPVAPLRLQLRHTGCGVNKGIV